MNAIDMRDAMPYFEDMAKKTKAANSDVKAIRERLGLTREELAVKLGVSLFTIGRWERGEFKISRLAKRNLDRLVAQYEKRG